MQSTDPPQPLLHNGFSKGLLLGADPRDPHVLVMELPFYSTHCSFQENIAGSFCPEVLLPSFFTVRSRGLAVVHPPGEDEPLRHGVPAGRARGEATLSGRGLHGWKACLLGKAACASLLKDHLSPIPASAGTQQTPWFTQTPWPCQVPQLPARPCHPVQIFLSAPKSGNSQL